MDRSKQREIASKGVAFEEARDAGRKGGIASHRRRREQAGVGIGEAESARPSTFESPAMASDNQSDRPVE